jgi:hypothetical protein
MLRFFTFGEVMIFMALNLPYLYPKKQPKSGKVMVVTRQGYGLSHIITWARPTAMLRSGRIALFHKAEKRV